MDATDPKIFVLDDEPLILRAMQMQLEGYGFEVATTSDPEEALATLEKHSFEVFICDQQMPVMTGQEMMTRIKGLYPQMKRFILTGASPGEAGYPQDLVELGVIQVFRKPCQMGTIVMALSEALGIEAPSELL